MASWVYDVATSKLVTLRAYAETRPWRQWLDSSRGVATVGVPPSTYLIPHLLVHSTKNGNLASIANGGLLTDRSGRGGLGGGDQSGKYVSRDGFLRAIWLGASSTVGREMRGNIEDYELFDIIVKVPRFFHELFMRAIPAVLSDDWKKPGTTILCFRDIPPEFLFYRNERRELVPLQTLDVNAVLEQQRRMEEAAEQTEYEEDEESSTVPTVAAQAHVVPSQLPRELKEVKIDFGALAMKFMPNAQIESDSSASDDDDF